MRIKIILFILLISPYDTVFAEEKPLWELGLGVAVINAPEYRGASEHNTFVFPFPFFNYNGKFVKAEGNKVRGLLFARDRLEINISVSGSTPGNSEDIKIRRGMPELDPTLEIGPTAILNLAEADDDSWRLQMESPFRAVVSSDFKSFRYRGWLFYPHLNLEVRDTWPGPDWEWGVSGGPVFATKRYHAYFYSVSPRFATPVRPAYTARGGYSGFRFTTTLSRRFPKFWIGAYFRYEAISGAIFDDSPLVTSKHDFSGGIAIAWIFKQSSKMVEVGDMR